MTSKGDAESAGRVTCVVFSGCGKRAEHTGTCMEVFHRVKQEQKRQSSFPQYEETKCKAAKILFFLSFL